MVFDPTIKISGPFKIDFYPAYPVYPVKIF